MRFFSNPGERALENEIDRLVREPAGDHEVVVAEHADALIGVASYERLGDHPGTGEFAVFVDEAHHGEGVGTLLLEHLAARAPAPRHHRAGRRGAADQRRHAAGRPAT